MNAKGLRHFGGRGADVTAKVIAKVPREVVIGGDVQAYRVSRRGVGQVGQEVEGYSSTVDLHSLTSKDN